MTKLADLNVSNVAGMVTNEDHLSGFIHRVAGDPSILRIVPLKHWAANWAWWAGYANLDGLTPRFYINKADHYNMAVGEWLCAWATSASTETWNAFDNVTIGDTDLVFYNDTPFSGTVYIAALPMYPFSRTQAMMTTWLADAHASDTTSSSGGIIGYTTERSNADGRIAPALPYYGFKLVGDRVGDKNKAILSACNHCSETPGLWVLEGALDWLLGGSANAETLLDYFEFYVYPCVNPQGLYGGWFRSSPETPTSDNNRLWSTTGTNEAVDAFKTAMAADTGGSIDVGFDYHSWMAALDIFGSVQPGDTAALYGNFNTAMQALDADYNLSESDITDSLRYWWKDSLSGGLTISMEQGGETARGVSEWKSYGANTMQALYTMLVDGRFTYGP